MRCFFHLLGPQGTTLLDEVGVDVSSLEEARTEALTAMAELRSEDSSSSNDWTGWSLRLVDDSDSVLADLPLSLISPLRTGKDAISCPT